MFPLPPRPIDTRCGGVTLECSPLLLLLDVMARYNFSGLFYWLRVLSSHRVFEW
jgi:hypothetical protein